MKSHTMVVSHIFSWSLTYYCISGIVEEDELRRVRRVYAISFFMKYHVIFKM